jgi:hypothetical protein
MPALPSLVFSLLCLSLPVFFFEPPLSVVCRCPFVLARMADDQGSRSTRERDARAPTHTHIHNGKRAGEKQPPEHEKRIRVWEDTDKDP